MNKQQAWEEWARPIAGHLVTALADSSHGKAFSAGWDAKAKQVPTGGKLDGFCSFIGSEPVENDGGWSLEVWNAAWEACKKQVMAIVIKDLADYLGEQL